MTPPHSSAVAAGALLLATVGVGTCAYAAAAGLAPAPHIALATLGLEAGIAAAALAAAAFVRAPVRARLGLLPGRLSGPQVALLALGMLALSAALDGVLDASGLREHSPLVELDAALQGLRGGSLALALLSLGVAPGVAEELLCRGLVQRGLQPRLGPAGAIAVGAAVFGLLHLDPVHGAFASILGAYLGIAAWLAGSVRPAIVCHVVNNLTAVALGALSPELALPVLPMVLGGLALAGACLAAVWRRMAPGSPKELQRAGCPDDP